MQHNMNDLITTRVIDAGGRYGIHPTWKAFTGELNYFSFEPDRAEAERLQQKYQGRENVRVVTSALGSTEGTRNLYILAHRGQSSLYQPNQDSVWFKNTRKGEGDAVGEVNVSVTTVDDFAEQNGIAIDFLKSDTEGSEYPILMGAKHQVENHILGVRLEVYFDEVYHGVPLFPEVFDFLRKRNMYLVNLSYDGRGDFRNAYVTGGRFGTLTSCDAVFLKRDESIFCAKLGNEPIACAVLKTAAFCFNNACSDIAIDHLLHFKSEIGKFPKGVMDSGLYKFVRMATHRLFSELAKAPGYEIADLDNLYVSIFGESLARGHSFMESVVFNPD